MSSFFVLGSTFGLPKLTKLNSITTNSAHATHTYQVESSSQINNHIVETANTKTVNQTISTANLQNSTTTGSKIPGTSLINGLKSQLKSPAIQINSNLKPAVSSVTVELNKSNLPNFNRNPNPNAQNINISVPNVTQAPSSSSSTANTSSINSSSKLKTTILNTNLNTAAKKQSNLPMSKSKLISANFINNPNSNSVGSQSQASNQASASMFQSSTASSASNIATSNNVNSSRANLKQAESINNSQSSFIFNESGIQRPMSISRIYSHKYVKNGEATQKMTATSHIKQVDDTNIKNEESRPTSMNMLGNHSEDSENNLMVAYNCCEDLDDIDIEHVNLVEDEQDFQNYINSTLNRNEQHIEQE